MDNGLLILGVIIFAVLNLFDSLGTPKQNKNVICRDLKIGPALKFLLVLGQKILGRPLPYLFVEKVRDLGQP